MKTQTHAQAAARNLTDAEIRALAWATRVGREAAEGAARGYIEAFERGAFDAAPDFPEQMRERLRLAIDASERILEGKSW